MNITLKDHCLYCGKTFERELTEQYCSEECKEHILNNNFQKGRVVVNCIYCNAEIHTTYREVRHGKKKFCDNTCVLLYKNTKKNDYIDCGDYIKIKIMDTHNNLSYCLVDKEDYDKVKMHRWHVFKGKNKQTGYACTNIQIEGKQRSIRMHRLLLDVLDNEEWQVDHINHNGLDNRRSNIRLCKHYENSMNSSKISNNAPYKGVSIKKLKKGLSYPAHIKCNNRIYRIGTYSNAIDAAKAYDYAAMCLFKKFANLNFVYSPDRIEIPDFIIRRVNIALYGNFKDTCTSKYIGVRIPKRCKFQAYIKINAKPVLIGYFDDELHAAYEHDLYIISRNMKRRINFTIEEICDYFNKKC